MVLDSVVPEVETSEGMLQLACVCRIWPVMQRIAFWRGEGGRQFMMQTRLMQRDADTIILFCIDVSVRCSN